jgi:hypothetical protein
MFALAQLPGPVVGEWQSTAPAARDGPVFVRVSGPSPAPAQVRWAATKPHAAVGFQNPRTSDPFVWSSEVSAADPPPIGAGRRHGPFVWVAEAVLESRGAPSEAESAITRTVCASASAPALSLSPEGGVLKRENIDCVVGGRTRHRSPGLTNARKTACFAGAAQEGPPVRVILGSTRHPRSRATECPREHSAEAKPVRVDMGGGRRASR